MKYLIIILFFLSALNLKAQTIEKQVIGSTGNTSTTNGLSLTATIGEVAIETKTGSFTLTEGYQQGYRNTSVSIEDFSINIDYTLFPNPSTDVINIKLNASKHIEGVLEIVNTLGAKVLDTKEFYGNETRTNFKVSNLPSGIYYLNIVSESKLIKVISFQKI